MAGLDTLIASINDRAASLRSLGYRVRLDLIDTGQSVLLDATGGAVKVTLGAGPADTVLRMSEADMKKLIAGQLSPMLAFSLGRLKIEGSRGVAMKLAGLLDED